jgi:hypothetical protein
MQTATYLLLAYSLLVVISLLFSGLRHPVRGTGDPAKLES